MNMRQAENHEYFADWSPQRGTCVARSDADPAFLGSLLDWVSELKPDSIVYLESNFETHVPELRNKIINLALTNGVELRTLPLRVTGQVIQGTFAHALDPTKTYHTEAKQQVQDAGLSLFDSTNDKLAGDKNAVLAIRFCVLTGQQTARPLPADENTGDDFKKFCRLRTGGLLDPSNKKKVFGPDQYHPWVLEKTKNLPPFYELRDSYPDVADVFGDLAKGKTAKSHRLSGYNIGLVLSTIIAAEESDTRNAFDKRMGMYAHGFGSLYRSNMSRRIECMVRSRAGMSLKGYHILLDKDADPRTPILHACRSQARRASRQMYHWFGVVHS